MCSESGAGTIVFSPLAQGVLTDRYLKGVPAGSRASRNAFLRADSLTPALLARVARLDAFARERGQTLAAMSLAWILRRPETTSVIVGASRPEQLLASLAALDGPAFADDELARLDANVETAANKLQYARAYANNRLAEPGVTTAAERAADIRVAGDQISMAQHSRSVDTAFLKASHELQVGEAKLGIINAIGNAGQNFFQNLTGYMQAKSKKSEAEATKLQDELDQTKDLFNQAQQLVDAVVQLMQAISSAETQSMRDAVQA